MVDGQAVGRAKRIGLGGDDDLTQVGGHRNTPSRPSGRSLDLACLDQPLVVLRGPIGSRRFAIKTRCGFLTIASPRTGSARPRASPHGQSLRASRGPPTTERRGQRSARAWVDRPPTQGGELLGALWPPWLRRTNWGSKGRRPVDAFAGQVRSARLAAGCASAWS